MTSAGPRVVVGTAGHIDHGKTSLLRALTGIDADRLPEEQRRGMTIDVGYAHVALPDGQVLDFVDVPGHDRLVGNMLVGAGEIDAALVVIAADDGPRAQTLEHLELLDALGLDVGVVALTKVDVLAADDAEDAAARRAALADEISRLVHQTSLRGSPIVPVSAVTGEGLDALRDALTALAATVRARPGFGGGPARLAIDRAFVVRGRGAVVTGTLRGGSIARGAVLRLEPDGLPVRVREVQVHGSGVDAAGGGGRVALNLAGVATATLRRGQVLGEAGVLTPTRRLFVRLKPAVDLATGRPRALPRHGERLRLHLATEQVDATVARDRRSSADLPGGAATAVLRLVDPIATAAGDRFVLRRPSPGAVAAGGLVLDATPPLGPSRRRATAERLAAAGGAATPAARDAALLELHGVRGGDHSRVAADVAATVEGAALQATAHHAATEPLAGGIPRSVLRAALRRELRRLVTISPAGAEAVATEVLARLLGSGALVANADRILLPGQAATLPDAVRASMARLEAALAVATPPGLAAAAAAAQCPPPGIRALEAEGRITRLEADLAYATPTYGRLAQVALRMAASGPLSPAAYRDATGTSRKYALAILEDLDRRGLLRRTPEGHIPGPRAATATPGKAAAVQ